ncbi:membrane-associated progesterone-binding protein 4 isoform X3 [Camellia sinensis]|uniref:membrane-associated progesterone-binding protein 4 isoform X3 n=1 Tax=Camellia sinensis TaxID=4442 RepID=UPI0010364DA1|nr:membrane-associated progesterone-binding protein 4 isoform X3 [Camellia sinensis]
MASPPFLGIAASLSLLLISLLLVRFFPLNSPPPPPPPSRLFTAQQLAIYNGTDDGLPIFLAILGEKVIMEQEGVTIILLEGDGLTDSMHGLSSTEVKSVVDWRDFYFKTYIFVGKLVGRYYDSEGNPTKYLKGAEAKAARGAQLMEKQKNEEAKLPSCNSRWSQDTGSEVWCDNGYPRLIQKPLEMAITGKVSKRCACFNEEELNQPGLEVYSGCDHFAKLCRL